MALQEANEHQCEGFADIPGDAFTDAHKVTCALALGHDGKCFNLDTRCWFERSTQKVTLLVRDSPGACSACGDEKSDLTVGMLNGVAVMLCDRCEEFVSISGWG